MNGFTRQGAMIGSVPLEELAHGLGEQTVRLEEQGEQTSRLKVKWGMSGTNCQTAGNWREKLSGGTRDKSPNWRDKWGTGGNMRDVMDLIKIVGTIATDWHIGARRDCGPVMGPLYMQVFILSFYPRWDFSF